MPAWLLYAVLSALAASLVAIFAKLGMQKVDATFATAIRSIVMTALLLIVCTMSGLWSKLPELKGRPLLMIVLSGAAGAASWLFYFRAVQLGDVSKVGPIDKLSMPLAIILAALVLGERPTIVNWLGVAIIVVGAYLAALPARS
jgi:transporter family protein